VTAAAGLLEQAGLRSNVMVDCSHANSRKSPERQAQVANSIAERMANGGRSVFGVMLESFLVEGRQDLGAGELVYGQSITDACMGWERTVAVLEELGEAVRGRRAAAGDG
jgi:3-deoxy-7-phosphoheptulonate synthase